METTDNTLQEMQQQMQQLREKLQDQMIVNDQLLRRSYAQNTHRLKFKSRLPIVAGLAGIALTPCIHTLGFSTPFIIFTVVLLAAAVVADICITTLIPDDMGRDLVTAAQDLARYHRIMKKWLRYGLPLLAVWLGVFIYEISRNTELVSHDMVLPICIGSAIGICLGLFAGLKTRRNILDISQELLSQIEQLRQ